MKVFILFCKANHLLYIVPTWYGSRTCADYQQKFFPSEHDTGRRFLLVTSHLFCLPAYLPACLPTYLPPSLASYLSIYLSIYIIYIHIYMCVCSMYVCTCVKDTYWYLLLRAHCSHLHHIERINHLSLTPKTLPYTPGRQQNPLLSTCWIFTKQPVTTK